MVGVARAGLSVARREGSVALDRRSFLVASAAASSSWVLGATGRRRPRADRVLLVVQLTGGNDGLNTVVPFEDDRYHRARPRLRVPKGNALSLDGRLGLHPSLAGLRSAWDAGELAVVTNVGVARPDRSHFRSMAIWHTGRTNPDGALYGWLGRASDVLGVKGGVAPAIHVGRGEPPLALAARSVVNPSIDGLDRMRMRSPVDPREHLRRLREIYLDERAGTAGVVASEAEAALALAARIDASAAQGAPRVAYPATAFGRQLRDVETLLRAGAPLRIVHVELDGFDTHAAQPEIHAALLRELADGLTAFRANAGDLGWRDRLLLFVFSEFGRRVRENASGGTDHGAAAPVLLLGTAVKAGVHGGPPDLENLDDGDVPMRVDFRRIYAAILESWLGLEATPILGERHEPFPVL